METLCIAVRFARTVGFCLLAGLGTAAAASFVPPAVADAFVTNGPSNNLSNNNYGAAGALGVSGSSSSKGTFASVIRFDLSTAKASFDATYGAGLWAVQSITLELTTTSPNNAIFNAQSTGQFSIVWMQDDSWTEGSGSPMTPGGTGITAASLPGFLGANDQSLGIFDFNATTSGLDGTKVTYTLGPASGLLSDIQGGGLASFEFLAASNGVSYLFNSRSITDGTRKPVLTVTAAAVPEPSEWFLIGLGCVTLAVFRKLRGRHAA